MRCLLWLFLFTSLACADPMVTDRPDFTESAQVVEPRKVQVEMGYTFSHAGDTQEHAVGELLVRLPLFLGVEARVGVNSFVFSKMLSTETSGLQDSSIGIKVSLLPEQAGLVPRTAVIVDTSVPTGGNPYRNAALQPGVKVCTGWELAPDWSLSANVNYDVSFSESVSLGWGSMDRWGSFFEVYNLDETAFFNSGITYLFSDDCQVDFRVGTGLNGTPNDYFIGAGISNRFMM